MKRDDIDPGMECIFQVLSNNVIGVVELPIEIDPERRLSDQAIVKIGIVDASKAMSEPPVEDFKVVTEKLRKFTHSWIEKAIAKDVENGLVSPMDAAGLKTALLQGLLNSDGSHPAASPKMIADFIPLPVCRFDTRFATGSPRGGSPKTAQRARCATHPQLLLFPRNSIFN